MQFSQNAAQLAQLSTHRTVVSDERSLLADEAYHEPMEQSELGSFVAHCVELLGLLTELYPTLLMKLVSLFFFAVHTLNLTIYLFVPSTS